MATIRTAITRDRKNVEMFLLQQKISQRQKPTTNGGRIQLKYFHNIPFLSSHFHKN